MRERKIVHVSGWGDGEDLGGVWGVKTRSEYIKRTESIFSKKP